MTGMRIQVLSIQGTVRAAQELGDLYIDFRIDGLGVRLKGLGTRGEALAVELFQGLWGLRGCLVSQGWHLQIENLELKAKKEYEEEEE